jgi:nicotinamidase/pyrazinamidase
MMMKTLILVDVQSDFTAGGALEVPGGDGIIEPINRIQDRFELVIATQDWHPPDHASFASNHEGKTPFDVIDLHGVEQTLWPDHCVQGSRGAEFHPSLETNRIETVFRKGMAREIDSYSGFYDNAHRKTTGLAGYLREKEAENLYFGGLAADICVYFTIRDALDEGFKVTLIEDAACPLDGKDYEEKRRELWEQGVDIVRSEEL